MSQSFQTTLSALSWRQQAERRLRLLRELQKRECRRDLLKFATKALAPTGYSPASHHRLLISKLQRVASGELRRLMVFMPPGSAKSTYSSQIFPAWFLAQNPRMNVIGASNTAKLAEDFSYKVQVLVRDNADTLGYGLETESVLLWRTTLGGQYRAVGVGGAVSGFRSDLSLIDDPVSGFEQASSQTFRDKTWDWYMTELHNRSRPGGRIVLVMTRWHEDDLAGRLLQSERDKWEVISLPAQAVDGDPLGRLPGEWLWADDSYGFGNLLKDAKETLEKAGAMRHWNALYQQDPRPAEGALFKVAAMPEPLVVAPAGGTFVRAWDLAATAQTGTRDPDWTVGLKLQRTPTGQFVVHDVKRLRGGPDAVVQAIVDTAREDGFGVQISLPQDPGQAGKAQALFLARALSGFQVQATPETGDKATRAAPVASQLNVGNVALMKADWNRVFLSEISAFPSGAKDDQVDALSRAFSVLSPLQDMVARFRALS